MTLGTLTKCSCQGGGLYEVPLTLDFVSSNTVGSLAAFPDPADTANGVINGSPNDGYVFDTTGGNGREFIYNLTVPAGMPVAAFDMFGTVGSAIVEQVRAYSLDVGGRLASASTPTPLPNGVPLRAEIATIPPGTHTVVFTDDSNDYNLREFSELQAVGFATYEVRCGKMYGCDGEELTQDQVDTITTCTCPPSGSAVAADPYVPAVPITCGALQALGAAGDVVPGQAYVVTDYSRGTVGPAQILTHGVTTDTVSWNVSVQTIFDDSAWAGRWDPDTCRIIELNDNLGNSVSSDNGDEIETFPWGVSTVTGNVFDDVDFNYSGGVVRDNVGGPTARLDVSGTSQVDGSTFHGLADVRVSDSARVTRTDFSSRGRAVMSGDASITDSEVKNFAYLSADEIAINYSRLSGASLFYALGAKGSVNYLTADRGYVDIRNVENVDIDELDVSAYGRVLAQNADRVRLLRSSAANSAYFQVNTENTLVATEAAVDNAAAVRVLTGELTLDNVDARSGSRIDHNSTGANRIASTQTTSGGVIEFLNDADSNLIDNSSASNSGILRFRGTSTDGRIHRSHANSGYFEVRSSNNVLIFYCTVDSIGYAQVRAGSNGFQMQYSTLTGYGRMRVEQASVARMLGCTIASTAYVRLRDHQADLRYSDFDSYFYYYLNSNTALKQGLNGSGRQSYTEPNPGTAVTGPGQRNW